MGVTYITYGGYGYRACHTCEAIPVGKPTLGASACYWIVPGTYTEE